MKLYSDKTDAAQEFMSDNKVGWIDPDGDVHPVNLFDHLAFFRYNSDAIPAITTLLSSLEEDALSRDWRKWRDEHPDLQCHEYVAMDYMLECDDEHGDMTHVIMKGIYLSGWGRVGTSPNGQMDLECSSDYKRSLTRKVRDFAALVGREVTVRTNDFEWVDDDGHLYYIVSPAAEDEPKSGM